MLLPVLVDRMVPAESLSMASVPLEKRKVHVAHYSVLPSSLSGFMTSATLVISEFTMVRALGPVNASPD